MSLVEFPRFDHDASEKNSADDFPEFHEDLQGKSAVESWVESIAGIDVFGRLQWMNPCLC